VDVNWAANLLILSLILADTTLR